MTIPGRGAGVRKGLRARACEAVEVEARSGDPGSEGRIVRTPITLPLSSAACVPPNGRVVDRGDALDPRSPVRGDVLHGRGVEPDGAADFDLNAKIPMGDADTLTHFNECLSNVDREYVRLSGFCTFRDFMVAARRPCDSNSVRRTIYRSAERIHRQCQWPPAPGALRTGPPSRADGFARGGSRASVTPVDTAEVRPGRRWRSAPPPGTPHDGRSWTAPRPARWRAR
ncbi:MAG: hypothetical protein JWN86_2534 [Planctomycetota bacterium]|nr:hypothetical protein [Planctomycetota bacterium]